VAVGAGRRRRSSSSGRHGVGATPERHGLLRLGARLRDPAGPVGVRCSYRPWRRGPVRDAAPSDLALQAWITAAGVSAQPDTQGKRACTVVLSTSQETHLICTVTGRGRNRRQLFPALFRVRYAQDHLDYCRANVAESQPSHQPAHVNWNVRCLLFSAPAAIARTVSQTSMHLRLFAL
jgi:hypothetical protein